VTNRLIEERLAQIFPKLTSSQLERLSSLGVRRPIAPGEVILEIGDRPRGLFVVLSGSIEALLAGSTAATDAELLFLLTTGDFTGELGTLGGTASFVRLRVRESGEVIAIDLEKVRGIVQADAELSELFMRAFILRRMALIEAGTPEAILLGSSHSANTLRLTEFLSRNARPFQYRDTEKDAEARELLERFHVLDADLPVVLCRGTDLLKNPSNRQVADCLGLSPQIDGDIVHDLLIVGAGPAGLAASVYAASEGLDVRLVETFAPGGQAGTSSRIENYLGFPTGISGQALSGRALSQARKFGAQLSIAWQAAKLNCERQPYEVQMAGGDSIRARTILIATGAQYRPLGLENLDRFLGAGVYYAATHIEAMLCRGEEVVVVGGGNSAGQAAVFLAESCRCVNIVVRSEGLAESMSRYLIRRIEASSNIQVHTRTEVTELGGKDGLEWVKWSRQSERSAEQRDIRHLFLMTGAEPKTQWLAGCVALDSHDFVKTGPELTPADLARNPRWAARSPFLLETSIPGVFAAGDVRSGSTKRIASAVGEGSMSVQFVHRVLGELTGASPHK
jgi:thioredoxin reductase (NADPH)